MGPGDSGRKFGGVVGGSPLSDFDPDVDGDNGDWQREYATGQAISGEKYGGCTGETKKRVARIGYN